MATVEKNAIKKVVEYEYVLRLNQDEAEVLATLTGHIIGSPSGTWRGTSDNIYHALHEQGVSDLNKKISGGNTAVGR